MASISVRVGAGADDGYWASPSTFNNASSSINLGLSSNRSGFMRFTGLSALHGATILSATLTLRSDTNQSTAVTFNIAAAAADNVAAPSSASDCTSQTRTTAQVSWPISASWSSGTDYDSPDITSIIQEMASSGYLASGVALLYIEWTSGSNRRDVVSYNGSSSYAPMLYVEYSTTVDKSTTDASSASVDEAAAVSATLPAGDASTVDVTEVATVDVVVTVSASDAATVAVDEAVVGIGVGATEANAVASVEGAAISVAAGVADDSTPIADEAVVGSTMLAADDAGAVGVSEATPAIALGATDASTVGITEAEVLRSIDIVTEPRVSLRIYNPSGGGRLGAGPIAMPLAVSYHQRAGEIGTWKATVAATSPNADLLQAGRIVSIHRAGEGRVFDGYIDPPEVTVGDDGAILLEVGGQSISARALWTNTLLGRQYSGETVEDAVTDLLAGSGIGLDSVGAGTISARFDGTSVWKAITAIADTMGWHVVEADTVARTISVKPAGGSSGLVIRQVATTPTDLAVVPLVGLKVPMTSADVWNRVIPLGAGEGVNALTLRWATRTSPYTIHQDYGPDGAPYWYIQDDASISAYGERTQVLSFRDIAPISNSAAEEVTAANTLYDVAAAWLRHQAATREYYEADVVGLKHRRPDGWWWFTIGQTVRLQWSGVVEDDAGRRLWKSIDADVYLMGFERTFNADGTDTWTLELATQDQVTPGPADAIVKAIDSLWAIQTAMRPYTYREIHGPSVESVASGQSATLPVTFDDNVSLLHKAVLTVRKRQVKSNVTGAAAGGGQTTSGGGGATSSGGSSHSHTITGKTTSSSGSHSHLVGDFYPTTTWSTPAYMQQITMKDEATGLAYGFYVGRNGTEAGSGKFESYLTTPHTHDVDGQTSSSESSHTHTVPSHTHTVSDHTHPMTYGIYLGPAASTPAFTITINGVDRTAALGGPWNGDISVDITPYLVDANGHVLRQNNSIVIGSSQLCDVEMTVRSLVSASSVVPV